MQSAKTKVNVLSFAAVEDFYDIMYLRREAFVVHMPGKDLIFKCRDKLYISERYAEGTVDTTVQENEILYSKNQVRWAKMAHEFLKNSGYPSLGEAVHLLTDGNVCGAPTIMKEDIACVPDIWSAPRVRTRENDTEDCGKSSGRPVTA
jgi:hypothetical protein